MIDYGLRFWFAADLIPKQFCFLLAAGYLPGLPFMPHCFFPKMSDVTQWLLLLVWAICHLVYIRANTAVLFSRRDN
jgi:hypothetical protein